MLRIFGFVVFCILGLAAGVILAFGGILYQSIGGEEWLTRQRQRAKEVAINRKGFYVKKATVFWGDAALPGVDVASFELVKISSTETSWDETPWGRDQHRAYFRQLPIEGSDSETFRAIDRTLAADKNRVYVGTERKGLASALDVVEDADGASFRHLQGAHFIDKDHVFLGQKIIEHADPLTFEKHDSSAWLLYRDSQFLFHDHDRLETTVNGNLVAANANEWRQLSDLSRDYFTDGVGVWHYHRPLMEADATTAVVLGEHNLKDANHVWYRDELVGLADPTTTVSVGPGKIKDASHVWSGSNLLADADVNTFEAIGYGFYRDKNHVWRGSRIVENADPATFQALSRNVYKDAQHVWAKERLVSADADSFVVVSKAFWKDKRQVFYHGRPFPDADPASFCALSSQYYKDDRHVWWRNKLLPEADTHSFELVSEVEGKDKNYAWWNGKRRPR